MNRSWTVRIWLSLLISLNACFLHTEAGDSGPGSECGSEVAASVLRKRANSSTCTNTTGAPVLDTTADGVLFHPCIAEQDGMSALGTSVLLLNHTGYSWGGRYDPIAQVRTYASAAQAGVPLDVTVVDPAWWDARSGDQVEGLRSTADIAGYAGWALVPSALSGLRAEGRLQPLDGLLGALRPLSAVWQDIPRVFRDAAAVYDGQVLSLPYSAEVPLLYWRKDVFAQLGLSPPATWDEALRLAAVIDGTQIPCSGSPNETCVQHGFCFGMPWGCFYDGLALSTIWASMVAAYGTKGGLYFDPATMQPLFTGPAMAEALRLYRALEGLGPRPSQPCFRMEEDYYLRHCSFGVSLTSLFKTFGFAYGGTLRGLMGVSLLPGSTLVQDRATGKLEPCTPQLCPYATPHEAAPPPPTPSPQPQPQQQEQGSETVLLVNRSPYLGRGAFSFALNRQAPPNAALAALRAFTYSLTYQGGWPLALDPTSRTSPVRTSHLSPAALPVWVAAGYHPDDTAAFLAVVAESLQHPNMALGARQRGGTELEAAVADAAVAAAYNGTAPEELVQMLSHRYSSMLASQYGGDVAALRAAYWQDLGLRQDWPAPGGPAMQPGTGGSSSGGGSSSLSPDAVAGIVVGCVLAAALVATLAAALLLRRRWRGVRSALQPVSAPGYSPDTSLCITDIQSSTQLWEALDAGVMDAALNLHNSVIRMLLPKHDGYECHTEGDSFIVAFPSAASAVAFALEVQVSMMHQPWPEAVLQQEPCAVVYHHASPAPAATAPAATAPAFLPSGPVALASPGPWPPAGGGSGGGVGGGAGPSAAASRAPSALEAAPPYEHLYASLASSSIVAALQRSATATTFAAAAAVATTAPEGGDGAPTDWHSAVTSAAAAAALAAGSGSVRRPSPADFSSNVLRIQTPASAASGITQAALLQSNNSMPLGGLVHALSAAGSGSGTLFGGGWRRLSLMGGGGSAVGGIGGGPGSARRATSGNSRATLLGGASSMGLGGGGGGGGGGQGMAMGVGALGLPTSSPGVSGAFPVSDLPPLSDEGHDEEADVGEDVTDGGAAVGGSTNGGGGGGRDDSESDSLPMMLTSPVLMPPSVAAAVRAASTQHHRISMGSGNFPSREISPDPGPGSGPGGVQGPPLSPAVVAGLRSSRLSFLRRLQGKPHPSHVSPSPSAAVGTVTGASTGGPDTHLGALPPSSSQFWTPAALPSALLGRAGSGEAPADSGASVSANLRALQVLIKRQTGTAPPTLLPIRSGRSTGMDTTELGGGAAAAPAVGEGDHTVPPRRGGHTSGSGTPILAAAAELRQWSSRYSLNYPRQDSGTAPAGHVESRWSGRQQPRGLLGVAQARAASGSAADLTGGPAGGGGIGRGGRGGSLLPESNMAARLASLAPAPPSAAATSSAVVAVSASPPPSEPQPVGVPAYRKSNPDLAPGERDYAVQSYGSHRSTFNSERLAKLTGSRPALAATNLGDGGAAGGAPDARPLPPRPPRLSLTAAAHAGGGSTGSFRVAGTGRGTAAPSPNGLVDAVRASRLGLYDGGGSGDTSAAAAPSSPSPYGPSGAAAAPVSAAAARRGAQLSPLRAPSVMGPLGGRSGGSYPYATAFPSTSAGAEPVPAAAAAVAVIHGADSLGRGNVAAAAAARPHSPRMHGGAARKAFDRRSCSDSGVEHSRPLRKVDEEEDGGSDAPVFARGSAVPVRLSLSGWDTSVDAESSAAAPSAAAADAHGLGSAFASEPLPQPAAAATQAAAADARTPPASSSGNATLALAAASGDKMVSIFDRWHTKWGLTEPQEDAHRPLQDVGSTAGFAGAKAAAGLSANTGAAAAALAKQGPPAPPSLTVVSATQALLPRMQGSAAVQAAGQCSGGHAEPSIGAGIGTGAGTGSGTVVTDACGADVAANAATAAASDGGGSGSGGSATAIRPLGSGACWPGGTGVEGASGGVADRQLSSTSMTEGLASRTASAAMLFTSASLHNHLSPLGRTSTRASGMAAPAGTGLAVAGSGSSRTATAGGGAVGVTAGASRSQANSVMAQGRSGAPALPTAPSLLGRLSRGGGSGGSGGMPPPSGPWSFANAVTIAAAAAAAANAQGAAAAALARASVSGCVTATPPESGIANSLPASAATEHMTGVSEVGGATSAVQAAPQSSGLGRGSGARAPSAAGAGAASLHSATPPALGLTPQPAAPTATASSTVVKMASGGGSSPSGLGPFAGDASASGRRFAAITSWLTTAFGGPGAGGGVASGFTQPPPSLASTGPLGKGEASCISVAAPAPPPPTPTDWAAFLQPTTARSGTTYRGARSRPSLHLSLRQRGPAALESDTSGDNGAGGGGGRDHHGHAAGHHGGAGGGSMHLCFRGFRVRVGICSGLVPGRDVVYVKDHGRRTAYSGACMQATKLISDAALGGMVLISASTAERLLPLPRKDIQGLIMWHKGRYVLGERGASHDAVRAAATAASHLLHAPCASDGPVAESIAAAAAADAAGLSTTAAASLATLALADDHGRDVQSASRDGSGALGPAGRSSGGTGAGVSGRLTAAMAALALASPSAAAYTRPAHAHVHLQTSRWCGGGLARGGPEAQDLYQAMVLPLAARQLLLERQPLRTHGPGPLLPGLLAAPVGGITLALVQVVGLPTLMAWDADVATAALARLTAAALQLLAAAGGYPAAAEGGELLAAFRSAPAAISWMVALEEHLRTEVDWPPELLTHELGDELVVALPAAAPPPPPTAQHQHQPPQRAPRQSGVGLAAAATAAAGSVSSTIRRALQQSLSAVNRSGSTGGAANGLSGEEGAPYRPRLSRAGGEALGMSATATASGQAYGLAGGSALLPPWLLMASRSAAGGSSFASSAGGNAAAAAASGGAATRSSGDENEPGVGADTSSRSLRRLFSASGGAAGSLSQRFMGRARTSVQRVQALSPLARDPISSGGGADAACTAEGDGGGASGGGASGGGASLSAGPLSARPARVLGHPPRSYELESAGEGGQPEAVVEAMADAAAVLGAESMLAAAAAVAASPVDRRVHHHHHHQQQQQPQQQQPQQQQPGLQVSLPSPQLPRRRTTSPHPQAPPPLLVEGDEEQSAALAEPGTCLLPPPPAPLPPPAAPPPPFAPSVAPADPLAHVDERPPQRPPQLQLRPQPRTSDAAEAVASKAETPPQRSTPRAVAAATMAFFRHGRTDGGAVGGSPGSSRGGSARSLVAGGGGSGARRSFAGVVAEYAAAVAKAPSRVSMPSRPQGLFRTEPGGGGGGGRCMDEGVDEDEELDEVGAAYGDAFGYGGGDVGGRAGGGAGGGYDEDGIYSLVAGGAQHSAGGDGGRATTGGITINLRLANMGGGGGGGGNERRSIGGIAFGGGFANGGDGVGLGGGFGGAGGGGGGGAGGGLDSPSHSGSLFALGSVLRRRSTSMRLPSMRAFGFGGTAGGAGGVVVSSGSNIVGGGERHSGGGDRDRPHDLYGAGAAASPRYHGQPQHGGSRRRTADVAMLPAGALVSRTSNAGHQQLLRAQMLQYAAAGGSNSGGAAAPAPGNLSSPGGMGLQGGARFASPFATGFAAAAVAAAAAAPAVPRVLVSDHGAEGADAAGAGAAGGGGGGVGYAPRAAEESDLYMPTTTTQQPQEQQVQPVQQEHPAFTFDGVPRAASAIAGGPPAAAGGTRSAAAPLPWSPSPHPAALPASAAAAAIAVWPSDGAPPHLPNTPPPPPYAAAHRSLPLPLLQHAAVYQQPHHNSALPAVPLPQPPHAHAEHAPPMQQRCVLRGLRVRCAADEGMFAQDGSISAARLYRSQHGGKTYGRLTKLCRTALMGQVLCTRAVAKRVHRAAVAGDATAAALQLTPLPPGGGKRTVAAAAAVVGAGDDADALAAAAAAVTWGGGGTATATAVDAGGTEHGAPAAVAAAAGTGHSHGISLRQQEEDGPGVHHEGGPSRSGMAGRSIDLGGGIPKADVWVCSWVPHTQRAYEA